MTNNYSNRRVSKFQVLGRERTPENYGHCTVYTAKQRKKRLFGGHVHRQLDRAGSFVCGYLRKDYTRTHPYPKNTRRINPLPREKAAIIMLRKKGYPMNMLSKALGRSLSFIHRVLRTAITRRTLHVVDMRKLPGNVRLYCHNSRWRTLMRFMPAWESWILGEGEEPP